MEDDELIKAKIRKNLIECRIEKGLTQTDVGKLVGKSKTAVASWGTRFIHARYCYPI